MSRFKPDTIFSFFSSVKFRILGMILVGFLVLSSALIQYGFDTAREKMVGEKIRELKQTTANALNELEAIFEEVRAGKLKKKSAREKIARRLAGPLVKIELSAPPKTFAELFGRAFRNLTPARLGELNIRGDKAVLTVTKPRYMNYLYNLYFEADDKRKNLLESSLNLRVFRDVSRTSLKIGEKGYLYIAEAHDPEWLLPRTAYPRDYTLEKLRARFAENFAGLNVKMGLPLYKKKFGDAPRKQLDYIRSYMTRKNNPPRDIRLVSHPFLGFRNVDNLKSADGKQIGRDITVSRKGFYSYMWSNPQEKKIRKKIAYIRYYEYRDERGAVDPDIRWVVVAAAYEHEAYAPIKNLRNNMFIMSAVICLLVGTLVFGGLRVIFVKPLNRLMEVMQRVNRGDLTISADLDSRSEFGYLAASFNSMLTSIRANHKHLADINEAYQRFVPHDFLKLLGRKSIVDVQLGDQSLQEMTVFFADMRDFTSLSEKMTPEENFAFINNYLKRMGPIIQDRGGFIDKYIGDAVMALFPRSPLEAIQAAIAMRESLREFNREQAERGGPETAFGIGIHTGSLMLGTVGEERRMEGTVISDSVNLAARMEKLTKIMGVTVIISEVTLAELEDPNLFHYRFLGSLKLKGKAEKVSVFEIYDGDDPEVLEGKDATRGEFEQGILDYYMKAYPDAIDRFSKTLERNPRDRAAELYLRHCRAKDAHASRNR